MLINLLPSSRIESGEEETGMNVFSSNHVGQHLAMQQDIHTPLRSETLLHIWTWSAHGLYLVSVLLQPRPLVNLQNVSWTSSGLPTHALPSPALCYVFSSLPHLRLRHLPHQLRYSEKKIKQTHQTQNWSNHKSRFKSGRRCHWLRMALGNTKWRHCDSWRYNRRNATMHLFY